MSPVNTLIYNQTETNFKNKCLEKNDKNESNIYLAGSKLVSPVKKNNKLEKVEKLSPIILKKRKRIFKNKDVEKQKKVFSYKKTKKTRTKEKLTKVQECFFRNCEPTTMVSLSRNLNGKITFKIPNTLREIRRVIYIFKNIETGYCLIGKTGQRWYSRASAYKTKFNKIGSEDKVKKAGGRLFLKDVKAKPENFQVGILYALKPHEDLNFFEKQFINYKRESTQLYNDNSGGGGGLAHVEQERVIYALPKSPIRNLTPEKYYPYSNNQGTRIRPEFSPTFRESLEKTKEMMGYGATFLYSIKRVDDERRYIGYSYDPTKRSREHGYAAEYHDTEHKKYDEERKGTRFHKALGKSPDQFKIGVFPLRCKEKVTPGREEEYTYHQGIGSVEKYMIKQKNSMNQGFNSNAGGGGPISQHAKKKLNFCD